MTAIIRPANASDVAVIADLNAHVQLIHAAAHPWRFKQPTPGVPSPADMLKILEQPDYFGFMADVGDRPVGYLTGELVRKAESPFHHPHNSIHIHHLAVHPEARRHGVATALMNAALAHGAKQGIALLTLDVWDFNVAARTFFARFGLVPSYQRLWNKID